MRVKCIGHKCCITTFILGMVTVMNAEGKPVQVPAGALQAANVQNHIGTHTLNISNLKMYKVVIIFKIDNEKKTFNELFELLKSR